MSTTSDPETTEEAHLRARIDALRDEIAAAQTELEDLRLTLSTFEARYDARIGRLIVQLDRLTLQIAEYERRIAALAEPAESWQRVEDGIKHAFHSERERLDREDEQTQQAEQRAATLPPDLQPEAKVALKRLYLQLSRCW